jgi:AcrR family transcriptional regulator
VSTTWRADPDGPAYDEMRTRIVDAAEQVIHDDGAGALRLDAVATQVGCHRSSVYRYFDSKEDLIAAVVVRAALSLGNSVLDSLADVDDPAEVLVEGLARSLEAMTDDRTHQALFAGVSSPVTTRIADKVVSEALQPLLRPLLEVSDKRGALRSDISTDDAMRWLLVVVAGLISKPAIAGDTEELRELLRKMLVPALIDLG